MDLARRRFAVLVLTLSVLLTIVAWPAPARAATAPGLVVSQVATDSGVLRFLLTPTHLAPGSTVDPATVRVKVGDTELRTEASVATDLTGAPARALVIVLDASSSATAGYLSAAKAAATSLAATLPADVHLGLFSTSAELLAPTLDRSAFTQAVAGVKAAGGFDPVEGVEAARKTLATVASANERRLLLITDGRQVFAGNRDTEVGANVAASGFGFDVVAMGAGATSLIGLRSLAEAAGGRLLTASDQASTTNQAQDAGRVFGPTLVVTVGVPATLAGLSSLIEVSAAGVGPTTATVLFAAAPPGAAAADPSAALSWVPDWLLYLVALLVFAALAAAALALLWPRSESYERIKQIAHFGPSRALPAPTPEPGPVPASTGARIARTALAASATVVRSGGFEQKIELGLERAGMRMRPHEWLLVRTLVTAGAGVLFAVLGGFFAGLVGLAAGWVATVAYQSVRVSRRAAQFSEQLPDGLQLVIGSLRSGFSLSQALESLVRESPEPLAAEFGRAVAEHRLGADLSDALERLSVRTGSEDLSWAVMAVRIQRDVGGNLAEVLQTSVDTMRERARLRRHVRSLSAEGRLSAWVLIFVPIVLGLFMGVYRRSYITPLFTDPRGLIMLVGGSILFVIGIFWMLRVIKVEA